MSALVAAAWWLAPAFGRWGIEPIYALAVGVIVGGMLQLGVQVPALLRIGALPHIGLRWASLRAAFQHPGLGRVLKQMAPALLGVSVAQLSLLINTQIASHQGVGAVSWLTYADRLMEFPTALLGVALGVVLLPQLTAAQSQNDAERYSGLLDWGLRLVLLLALPCAVALLVFPKALVSVLYHYGAITPKDVDRTALALMGYGVGLMGLVGVKILAPGFYARQDIRTPVRIAVVVLILTQLTEPGIRSLPWPCRPGPVHRAGCARQRHVAVHRIAPRGPVLATARLGACSRCGCCVATALLGVLLAWLAQTVDWIGLRAHPWQRIGWMAVSLASAAALYFACLHLSGLRLRQFVRRG